MAPNQADDNNDDDHLDGNIGDEDEDDDDDDNLDGDVADVQADEDGTQAENAVADDGDESACTLDAQIQNGGGC